MFFDYSTRATRQAALAGGPRGIRTPDLLNAIETRSQLRYGPGQFTISISDLRFGLRLQSSTGNRESVDLRGFEPLTSSVRLRRAPNCATGPENGRRVFYLRQGWLSSKTGPARTVKSSGKKGLATAYRLSLEKREGIIHARQGV